MNIGKIKKIWRREQALQQMVRAAKDDRQLQKEGKPLDALQAMDDASDYAELARQRGASREQIRHRLRNA